MSTSTSTSRNTVTTPLAPAAIGPYSQGILVNDRLYVSGQIAIDPDTYSRSLTRMPWLYGPMAAGASGVVTVLRDVEVDVDMGHE